MKKKQKLQALSAVSRAEFGLFRSSQDLEILAEIVPEDLAVELRAMSEALAGYSAGLQDHIEVMIGGAK